jgi:hypothetical protein
MSYEMPEVRLGEWVYFYPHEGAEPSVGVVTKVAKETVVLWVISPGYGGTEKPSVHHVSDPRLADYPDWKPYGLWDHQPRDPKVSILSEKLAFLEKKLADLEGRKAK